MNPIPSGLSEVNLAVKEVKVHNDQLRKIIKKYGDSRS